MKSKGHSLGLLLSVGPDHPNFQHAVNLAAAALRRDMKVYLYCVDEAVLGVANPDLQELKELGLNLFACAYAAQQHNLPIGSAAAFSGLSVVSDLMAETDRFVSLN